MELEVPKLEELALTEINGEPCMPGVETNLAELLLTAAHSRPEGLCLEAEATCYTFAQVARMTSSIRKVLRKALLSLQLPAAKEGHEPEAFERRLDEHVVTIVLDRGVKSIAAVHAVMLERCCYNAFDVGEPLAKLKSWVEVSRPPVMISSAANLKRLGVSDVSKDLSDFPRLVVDVDVALKVVKSTVPHAACSPEDLDRLAYLIFTSGSTGKPKAVMIRHKSALNVVRLWTKYVGLTAEDRFAQVASMSWDVHVIEVYGTMAARATSVTCEDLVKKSGPDMLQWLKEREITGMSVVPSHLRSMAQGDVSRSSLPQLRLLDVGGEALGLDVVETWAPGRKLFNSYGPSEISVVCTGTYVEAGDVITIGAPLPTYQCHILDPETLTPVGSPSTRGVLFVGGIGLARGYLEEEEKTKAKFLDHPQLGRIYNTGDLAAWDEFGRIHYHGRTDWQVQVRGIRIELEALEQAITALPTVKHCEARVIDDRLVLLVSGEESSEANLKSTAAALGRGYVLSQVKFVDVDAWKFNTSGKLLRNVVPFEAPVAQRDAWEAFDKSTASDLEQEIAQCIAPQVSDLDRWSVNSHFMEDLGIDSGGFGRLISRMRQGKGKLCQVNLQMLFEYPTIHALASHLHTVAVSDVDDAVVSDATDGACGAVAAAILEAVEAHPHRVAWEDGCESRTYLQIYRMALGYQRLIRSKMAAAAPAQLVAVWIEGFGQQMAAVLGIMLEAQTFCVVKSKEELKALNPTICLAPKWVKDTCTEMDCLFLDAGYAAQMERLQTLAARAAQDEDVCGVALVAGVPVPVTHSTLLSCCAEWRPHLAGRRMALTPPNASIATAALAALCHGATVVDAGKVEILVEEKDAASSSVSARVTPSRRVLISGKTWLTSTPELSRGFTVGSFGSMGTGGASPKSMASELAPYILGSQKSFGPRSWPVLCGVVQGVAIFAQPVMVAGRLLLADRLLLPVALAIPLWQSLVALLTLLFFEQLLRVLGLAAVKWTLIGRYREGDHDIYSLYYLRHWLVEHLAKGTIVGQSAHQGSSVAFLFMRNLALKALGADIALTSVVTARVVAYDLISVKDLATVHGPRHLTGVNYGSRRMVLRKVKVGEGAFVGPNCTMEPGCEVAPAGYVEPLSTVSAGTLVEGRVTGVPAQVVGPVDLSRLPSVDEVQKVRRNNAVVALGYWLLLLPKAMMPFMLVVLFRLLQRDPSLTAPVDFSRPSLDALPPMLMAQLPWLPLIAFAASMVHTILQLLITAVLCRYLPKMKPPCTYPLTHWRAQIAGLKMSMVLQAAEMLADASIVPAFIRLCGAKMGPGCVMGLQVTLPETLVVGQKSFFATGNILTSVDVDRGQFKVPCITYMGNQTFLGNHNHLPEGLPDNSFCGVGTWLPKRPTEPNMSYFGNPAMKFRRLSSQAAGSVNQGPEKAHFLARFWHHFSTSVMDVFLYRGVQGSTTAMAFFVSRTVCPFVSEVWEPVNLLLIYIGFALGSWYLFSVVLGNLLFNGHAPRSNAYYSTTVTRWFTALTAQQRVFKLPFQTAGSRWQAPILRLLGARVGKRFFCMNELVLVDAPFTEVGDDVTVDYDGQIRCHSFEDFRLKFVHYKIGHRVTIMSGASVAMCDAGDGAVLRPGSLTWKGSNLEPNTVYEGAPAAARDVESGSGPTLLQKTSMLQTK